MNMSDMIRATSPITYAPTRRMVVGQIIKMKPRIYSNMVMQRLVALVASKPLESSTLIAAKYTYTYTQEGGFSRCLTIAELTEEQGQLVVENATHLSYEDISAITGLSMTDITASDPSGLSSRFWLRKKNWDLPIVKSVFRIEGVDVSDYRSAVIKIASDILVRPSYTIKDRVPVVDSYDENLDRHGREWELVLSLCTTDYNTIQYKRIAYGDVCEENMEALPVEVLGSTREWKCMSCVEGYHNGTRTISACSFKDAVAAGKEFLKKEMEGC